MILRYARKKGIKTIGVTLKRKGKSGEHKPMGKNIGRKKKLKTDATPLDTKRAAVATLKGMSRLQEEEGGWAARSVVFTTHYPGGKEYSYGLFQQADGRRDQMGRRREKKKTMWGEGWR